MRVVVTGAGAVGRHLAADLAERGHEVTLIEQDPATVDEARRMSPRSERDPRRRVRALGARGRRAVARRGRGRRDRRRRGQPGDVAARQAGVRRAPRARPRQPPEERVAVHRAVGCGRGRLARRTSSPRWWRRPSRSGDLVRLLRLEGGRISIVEMTLRDRLAVRRAPALRAAAAARLGDRRDPPRRPRRHPAARDGVRPRATSSSRSAGAGAEHALRATIVGRLTYSPPARAASDTRRPARSRSPADVVDRPRACARSWLTNTRSASTSGASPPLPDVAEQPVVGAQHPRAPRRARSSNRHSVGVRWTSHARARHASRGDVDGQVARPRTACRSARAPPGAAARERAPTAPPRRTASSGSRRRRGRAPRPCPPPRRAPTGPGSAHGSSARISPAGRQPVEVRQVQVQHDEVRRVVDHGADGRTPVARRPHDVAARRQRALDRTQDLRLVVDDQHDRAAHGRPGIAHAERRAAARRVRAPRSRRPSRCANPLQIASPSPAPSRGDPSCRR